MTEYQGAQRHAGMPHMHGRALTPLPRAPSAATWCTRINAYSEYTKLLDRFRQRGKHSEYMNKMYSFHFRR